MAKTLAPEVRSKFAKRLKDMRVRNGFPRARYFAKSLGIEENRYTRYERAEVEPNLTLIHKMCETLRVSPNELLGFIDHAAAVPPSGLAEDAIATHAGDDTARQHGLLAWRLAAEATAIRARHRTKSKPSSDPLMATRETGKLFQRLQSDPFGTVAEIAADEALRDIDPHRQQELAELISAYTDSVTRAAVPASASRR